MRIPTEEMEKFVEELRAEVDQRRKVWLDDPVAKGMEHALTRFSGLMLRVSDESNTVTVDQYAAEAGVTPQTVRRWIRAKELPAEETPHGWRIPAGAERVEHVERAVERVVGVDRE